MGAIKLELHCPQNVNGMVADPQPDWSFDDLLSELDTIEKKLIPSLDFSVLFDKKRPRNIRASKENRCNTGGFVMHVSDHELFSDSDVDEEVVDSSMVSGGKFYFEELDASAINIYLKDGTYLDRTPGTTEGNPRPKINGGILDISNLKLLDEKRKRIFALSFLIHNTKPVGHQDLVGLVISILILGDFSLVLLTLLQLYSFSLADVFFVLLILPLGILLPFPAGINALFSHGPRRSAGLARVYALWNILSLINVGVAFICGYLHHCTPSSKRFPNFQSWNKDENEWWIFPFALIVCKCIQSQLVNWHVANLEIQDRSLYSNNFNLFWQS